MADTVETKEVLVPGKGTFNLPDRGVLGDFDWSRAGERFTWAKSGKINIAHEAVDRHVAEGRGDKPALIYVDDDRRIDWTFRQLKERSDNYAALLRSRGIQRGDRVFIFLPKVPELYAAILGVIKAGAIAGPLFEAFYAEALKDRLGDCGARFLITDRDLARRVPYSELPELTDVWILGEHFQEFGGGGAGAGTAAGTSLSGDVVATKPDKGAGADSATLAMTAEDLKGIVAGPLATRFWHLEKSLAQAAASSGAGLTEWLDLEDGYIIHYTSGSTGKPKGILHAHRAMIQLGTTGDWVLDLRDDDVYWCTAHPGWVTGSAYGVFAPWLNGATVVANGGRFSADVWFKLIDDLKISVWYSAPTAFRMLMSAGPDLRREFDLSSLRHILSVGEPLNPELIYWSVETFGVRIHDTWWMTETGAQLIVNLPSDGIRPGSMGLPLPGLEAAILDAEGREVPRGDVGQLAVRAPWPSIMKTVWNQPEKYKSYFVQVEGRGSFYLSGDSARMDEEGRIWFQGRGDDIIVSSGEKISPFEVESTLIEHPAVAEAGVIGKPDELRGSVVKAFVVLRDGQVASEELAKELKNFVKTRLSAHAYPREVEILAALPKTRVSGKIMRRVLKAWELGTDLGDTTTLETSERLTLAKC